MSQQRLRSNPLCSCEPTTIVSSEVAAAVSAARVPMSDCRSTARRAPRPMARPACQKMGAISCEVLMAHDVSFLLEAW